MFIQSQASVSEILNDPIEIFIHCQTPNSSHFMSEKEESALVPPVGTRFQFCRWSSFVIGAIIYLFAFFQRICPSVVADDMAKAYGVRTNDLGVFSSMYFYSYGAVQPFAGLLADIMDPCILIGGSALVSGLGAVICGLSKTTAVGMVGRLLVGLGCGPVLVPICKMISTWFPLTWYPVMVGVTGASGIIGAICAQAPLAAFTQAVGWRWPFYTVGILSGAFGVLCLAWARGHPRHFGFACVNEEQPRSESTVKEKLSLLWENFKFVVTKVPFWQITGYTLLTMGPGFDMTGLWLAPYLMHAFGYSKAMAGNVALSMTIGNFLMATTVASIAKLVRSSKWTLTATAVMGTVVSLIFVFVPPNKISMGALVVMMAMFGYTANSFVLSYAILREKVPLAVAGSATGCCNGIVLLLPAVYQIVSSEIIGKKGYIPGTEIYDNEGFRFGLWTLFAVSMGLSVPIMASVSPKNPEWDKEKSEMADDVEERCEKSEEEVIRA
jgi:sugar phosphate permease